ncbi:MAG: tRNA (adenosine(37)-N6)-threonylcarbamoyltransferase complex dimerization subunit type 1 TsaB [Pseudomonadota bacterium]|jgi:tRNA threonylcarbamoyladenosine biosynthesis protein TsaB|nr:tRNA (adenosine(37)-N6)-threonylcarbamoyltransferase complex dimerization subunit type 1 TsaB [Rhodospirillaceae bacterium]MEE2720398.1 tRNA (adenosine(37)-N6)-threonylcarbamoyltransferase complex dimerization subunit type 1 TsaB [Pseudomonadota bacterium]
MPLTLAIDTAGDACAAGLIGNGKVLAQQFQTMPRGHAEALVPMVQKLAGEARVGLADIDLVAVTIGPGSYTGVRTGIAAARGFALGAQAPAAGVSSLQAVARGAAPDAARPILCVLETRRADYFAQLFDPDGSSRASPIVAEGRTLADLVGRYSAVLAGNAVGRLIGECPALKSAPVSAARTPRPGDIAALAETDYADGGLAPDTLSPLYLRAAEAKLPPQGGRLKPVG